MSESGKKIKQILSIWGNADEICREKSERVFELRRLCREAGEINGVRISDMPKAKGTSSHVENSVIRTIDVYEKTILRLEQEIKNVLQTKAYIDSVMSFFESDEKKIITLRYREGLSWDYIPEIIHKSRMQCFRIHNRVIERLTYESFIEDIVS